MRQTWLSASAALFCTIAFFASESFAQVPDASVSAGYSNLETQKADGVFYDHNGAYVDANFEFPVSLRMPLLLGAGITGSGYWESENVPYINGNYNGNTDLFSNVGLFELEPRIGIKLGDETGFFAIPRLGAGLLIDSYGIDQAFTSNSRTYIDTQNFTGVAFEVRPALQVGYSWGPAAAGIEGSYMYAVGSFGSLGSNAQEVRVGAFFQCKF